MENTVGDTVPELDVDLTRIRPSAKYDLLGTVTKYLDPHMVFPLITYLGDLKIYDAKDVAKAKFELARKTSMAEYAITVYQEMHGEDVAIPKELEDAKESVAVEWRRHMDAAAPLVHVIDNGSGGPSDTMLELQNVHNFTLEHLYEHFGVTRDAIEALFDCAKFRFDCGEYDVAAFYLGVYRDLCPTGEGGASGSDRSLKALWGRFAGHMLTTSWEEADKDRELLRGVLSKTRMPELESLQQRTWLLHWSLFVFANHPKGKDNLVDFFLQDSHMNAIQLNAPWLLRYVCAVVLTNKKRQNYMRQILRIISQEGASYVDPITQFVERLLIHFDFDGAQERLAECESVIVTDFFLSYLTTPRAFMEAARLFIFETYCRIHQKIDLPTLAARLHMDEAGAEAWVVDLIRNASLDAKVDSIGRQVIMTVPAASVYQLVIDKTRELTVRTRALHDNIEAAM